MSNNRNINVFNGVNPSIKGLTVSIRVYAAVVSGQVRPPVNLAED
jgi:hypothetical protein